MGDSVSTATGILKTDYEGALGSLINTEHPFLSKIKRKTKGWVGKQLAYGVITARNAGSRGINPDGKLPVAGNVGTAQTSINSRTIAGRGQISVDLINSAKTDKGAFIEGIELTMEGLKESCANNLGRQTFGRNYRITGGANGYKTGLIGKVTTGANSATQTFDTNHYFEPGRAYYIGTTTQLIAASAGAPSGGVTASVVSVSTDGVTVVFDGIISTTTADYVCQYDANGGSFDREIGGTEFLVDDGTTDDYLGVDPATYSAWAATVKGNGVVGSVPGTLRPLTLRLMDLTVDAIQIASGKYPNLMVVDESFRREYVELLRNDVRYAPGQLAGGDATVSYTHFGQKIEMVTDRQAPYGVATFLNTNTIDLAEKQPWKFMEADGSVLSRVPDYFAYELTYGWQGELATHSRNTHGKLADVSYSLTA